MQEILETDRLYLKPLTLNDATFMRELVNTKGWLEFVGTRNVHSQKDAIAYVERLLNIKDLQYFVVKHKTSGISMGIISFLKRDYLEASDIGFAFLPEFMGKGYAFESAKKVLQEVSRVQNHEKILATTLPNNTASIALLKKLGFRFKEEIREDNETLMIYEKLHFFYVN